ncbi:MAG: hypothetical protein J6Y33_03435 [Prevotella sp.]|nr:hypothetical protein [Prevotella sp.]
MAKRLPYIQGLVLSTYIDCKKRSKKDVSDFNIPNYHIKADEEMIRFMLSNTSITDHDSERSFRSVDSAVSSFCHILCPGEWCTREHCLHHQSGFAYNCGKGTRPAVCKDFKKWREGQKKRAEKKESKEDRQC